jgi:hypothetical protein
MSSDIKKEVKDIQYRIYDQAREVQDRSSAEPKDQPKLVTFKPTEEEERIDFGKPFNVNTVNINKDGAPVESVVHLG